jgi:transcription initiation factor TFIID/TFIIF subunit
VDHVEYILHQTFEPPVRSKSFLLSFSGYPLLQFNQMAVDTVVPLFSLEVNEFPFQLQEQGWGEFDMKIMLHFVDKSVPPFVLDHDLHFQSTHYEVPQTIVR